MIKLNFKSAESLIFNNVKIRAKMPEFNHYFDQWKLGRQHSFLKNLGVQAIIDLVNNLNDSHIKILEKFYNSKFVVEKFSNKVVENFKFNLEELIDHIDEIPNEYFIALYRNEKEVFATCWT